MNLLDFMFSFILDPYFIVSLVFWIIVFSIANYVQKKNRRSDTVQVFFPFYALIKTKKLNLLLKKLGQKYKKFWIVFFTIGVFVSFAFVIFGVYFIINNLIELFTSPKLENTIQPLIPGVTVSIPIFSYFIIPLIIAIVSHEFAHAVAATSSDCRIKSTGILMGGLFYILLPGAFVEPDDFEIESEKTSIWTRLRIYSAGTYVNAIETLVFFLLLINFSSLISPFYGPQVFRIDYVLPQIDGGYNYNNLQNGDIITAINGTPVDIRNHRGLSDFLENRTEIKCSVGDNLVFTTLNKGLSINKTITLGSHFFLGFTYKWSSNTSILIDNVYDKYQGGNNYDTLKDFNKSIPVIAIDNYYFNKTQNKTIGTYLINKGHTGIVNITTIMGENYSIYIDYFPLVFGAYEFKSFYVGAFFSINNYNTVKVDRVLSDLTENGINGKMLQNNDIITEIEGVPVNVSTHNEFEELILSVTKNIDEETNVSITILRDNKIIKNQLLKIIPIPKSYVFIGIRSTPYWLSKGNGIFLLNNEALDWIERELFFSYVISFSLTLFNMIPILFAVFPTDGLYIIKELLYLLIGKKIIKDQKKTVYIPFDPDESVHRINVHRVNKVLKVDFQIQKHDDVEEIENIPFEEVDTIADGYIDSVSFDLNIFKSIPKGTPIKISLIYEKDILEKKKKISIISLGLIFFTIILMNFAFSYAFLGNFTFWL